jgi:hypothetical protein
MALTRQLRHCRALVFETTAALTLSLRCQLESVKTKTLYQASEERKGGRGKEEEEEEEEEGLLYHRALPGATEICLKGVASLCPDEKASPPGKLPSRVLYKPYTVEKRRGRRGGEGGGRGEKVQEEEEQPFATLTGTAEAIQQTFGQRGSSIGVVICIRHVPWPFPSISQIVVVD